jgi:hypothetical protein
MIPRLKFSYSDAGLVALIEAWRLVEMASYGKVFYYTNAAIIRQSLEVFLVQAMKMLK